MSSLLLVVASLIALLVGSYFSRQSTGSKQDNILISIYIFFLSILTSFFLVADYFTGEGINDAVIFHLLYGLDGTGFSEFTYIIFLSIMLFILSIGASFWFYCASKRSSKKITKVQKIISGGLLLLAFIINPAINNLMSLYGKDIVGNLDFNENIFEKRDFDESYRMPSLRNNTNSHRNIIYIYAEQLERTYFDETIFPGLIKGLRKLESKSTNFKNIDQINGSGYTIAGMVSSQCGLPLIIPTSGGNSMSGMDGILTGATCIGDLLGKEGYLLSYLGGASLDFAGKGKFYKAHGFTNVRGREELAPMLKDKSYQSGWGLFDDSLLDIAYKDFIKLSSENKKFGLFLLTLDTHHPNGHPSKSCEGHEYKDGSNAILNSVACSDYLLSNFVNKIIDSPYGENTLIVVTSDHLAMSNTASSLLRKGERKNLFMIVDPQNLQAISVNKNGSPLDIGPTILEKLGYKASLGLGRNLLSDAPSLKGQFSDFNTALSRWRKPILKFWDTPKLNDIQVDGPREIAKVGGKSYKIPTLITFNESMDMELFFEFYNPKKVVDYLYELDMDKPFIWIDNCNKMPVEDKHLKFDLKQYCVMAGKLGASDILSARVDPILNIGKDQLERLFSREANIGTYSDHIQGIMHSNIPGDVVSLFKTIPDGSIAYVPKNTQSFYVSNYSKSSEFVNKKLKYTESIPIDEDFFFLPGYVPLVREDGFYTWESMKIGIGLREFIRKHLKNDTIILSVMDEATENLSADTINYFSELGLDIKKLKFRGSFAAVLKSGKVIAQGVDNHAPVLLSSETLKKEGIDLVESAGWDAGNRSKIIINGDNLSLGRRGINIVVLQENGDKISIIADTYLSSDHVGSNILKATYSSTIGVIPVNVRRLFKSVPDRSLAYVPKNAQSHYIARYAKSRDLLNKKLNYTESIPLGKEFYFLSDDLPEIKNIGSYTWNVAKAATRLDAFIQKHLKSTIILSVMDEATNNLSEDTANYLSGLGLDINKLKHRGSFAAVLKSGKVIAQGVDNNASVLLSSEMLKKEGIDLVESAGWAVGNRSKIIVKGENLSLSRRGINIVILQENGETKSSNIDTYLSDRIGADILKATPTTIKSDDVEIDVLEEKQEGLVFSPLRIAHAGGGIDGLSYTNSYDALNHNIKKGYIYFELDFSITKDRKIVCLHDWTRSFKHAFGFDTKERITQERFEFLTTNNYKYRKCTLDGLVKWLEENPKAKIVTDIKENNLWVLSVISEKVPDANKRIIPQLYQPENYSAVKAMGYEHVIWTLYRWVGSNDDVIAWIGTFSGPIAAVTMPKERGKTTLPKELSKINISTYVHTINSPDEMNEFLDTYMVTNVYTDFLPSE